MICGAIGIDTDFEAVFGGFATIHSETGLAFGMFEFGRPASHHGFADHFDNLVFKFRGEFHVGSDGVAVDSVDFPFIGTVVRDRSAVGVGIEQNQAFSGYAVATFDTVGDPAGDGSAHTDEVEGDQGQGFTTGLGDDQSLGINRLFDTG